MAEERALLGMFGAACVSGDLDTLTALLDPAVTALSDAGSRVRAALRPVVGVDRVGPFLLGIFSVDPESASKNARSTAPQNWSWCTRVRWWGC